MVFRAASLSLSCASSMTLVFMSFGDTQGMEPWRHRWLADLLGVPPPRHIPMSPRAAWTKPEGRSVKTADPPSEICVVGQGNLCYRSAREAAQASLRRLPRGHSPHQVPLPQQWTLAQQGRNVDAPLLRPSGPRALQGHYLDLLLHPATR
jgi:hypothetical protein